MAGNLKFAAISIIAAALLAVACSDSGGSPEPTPSPSATPAPTATATTRPARPTETPIPPGIFSPSATPGWTTYASPLGYSLDFPDGWTVFEAPHESLALTLLNEIAAAESARRRAEGITEFPTLQSGEAWMRIVRRAPVLFEQVRFVAEDLSSICGRDVTQTTVNGNPALDCGHLLWIQMPGGRLLSVSMANVGQDLETQNLLDAALATITFRE